MHPVTRCCVTLGPATCVSRVLTIYVADDHLVASFVYRYSEYLSRNGGYSNAFTDKENTNYHFQVTADAFEGALDRFSQFFIAPLFTASATDRELNAVDSENSKNLQVSPSKYPKRSQRSQLPRMFLSNSTLGFLLV